MAKDPVLVGFIGLGTMGGKMAANLQKAPDLDMTLAGLPLEFDGKRPPYRNSAPKLGEHNDFLSEMLAPKKAAS